MYLFIFMYQEIIEFLKKILRKYRREWEHLSRQVRQIAKHNDEAGFDDLDILGNPGQHGYQNGKHNTKKRASKCHNKEWNWKSKTIKTFKGLWGGVKMGY